MRFAYADPPYPGQAKRHYANHPDYAGEVDHAELIARLECEFPDGWALSTSATALRDVLALCPVLPPSELRICVWFRGPRPFKPNRITWCWEPLIVRTPHWRQQRADDWVRDAKIIRRPSGVGSEFTGAKPVEFCYWLFELLGAEQTDELIDLFPGSGAVGAAWDAWRRQMRLAI